MNKNTDQPSLWRQNIMPILGLFASVGTLLCCALPALLVTLGMGAALAGFVGAFPWISIISIYKIWVFIGAGVLLAASAYMQWKSRFAPCPVDPLQAKACMRLRALSKWILIISIGIYAIGFFFAFIAVHIFY